jgi:hypothetical protein
MTNVVTIRQKIDCTIALSSDWTNSTDLLKDYKDPLVAGVNYAAIPYGASQYKALTEYTTGASIFSN